MEGANAASGAGHEASTLGDYLQLVRRRKWVIAQALVLVPLAAALFSLTQGALHQASAEVLIVRQSLAAAIAGATDPAANQSPERVLQTQAEIASSPRVAAAVLEAAGDRGESPESFLARSSVSVKPNADLLIFSVTDPDQIRARELATEYARQYILYRASLDTESLARARGEIEARVAELERDGRRDTPLYSTLVEREQQLRTAEALQRANASLARAATHAERIQPRPLRNAAFGLALGLVLGIGLALLWEALDTRVRSTDEAVRRLGLPLLARVPAPPRWMRRAGRLVMLADPNGVQAEAFRVLRTNFDFFNLERGARVVMVTSAVGEEGKSTTVANLAVALARAGQRVALVDLDLRRPILDRLFGFQGQPGIVDVTLGQARLGGDDAGGSAEGSLKVLTSGPLPRDPGEFVSSPALVRVLDELREQADVVLVDAPPLLVVGDTLALSAIVDAVIVVSRLNVVRRAMLDELRRVLDTVPAHKLGLVVTGADEEQESYGAYRYGYGYSPHGYGKGPREETRRG